jgi:alpha-N-arabinofuranosidase
VTWADNGFPIFGKHGRLALEEDTPLELSAPHAVPVRDDFNTRALACCWNYLRNPQPELYSLEERPGHLRLRGSAAGLDDLASPAWLGQRQCHFAVQVAARLEFEPETAREEAGLVVRMNERHHYEIFVTRRSGARSVVLRRVIGSLRAEVACQPLPQSERGWVLAIQAERTKYVFCYGPSEHELQPLGEGETRYLSTEVAGGFTGVYFAMYATGNGAPCAHPADFDWFDYQAQEDRSAR